MHLFLGGIQKMMESLKKCETASQPAHISQVHTYLPVGTTVLCTGIPLGHTKHGSSLKHRYFVCIYTLLTLISQHALSKCYIVSLGRRCFLPLP